MNSTLVWAVALIGLMATEKFYVSRGGEVLGEFESGAIRRALADGRLTRDDYIWQQGFTQWESILAFFDAPKSSPATEAAMDWAKEQTTEEPFMLPDRQPGEAPATAKQLDYIRQLVVSIDEEQLQQLGKWQASSLIDQLKQAKASFTAEKTQEAKRMFFGES